MTLAQWFGSRSARASIAPHVTVDVHVYEDRSGSDSHSPTRYFGGRLCYHYAKLADWYNRDKSVTYYEGGKQWWEL
jgi:hypothetical protein